MKELEAWAVEVIEKAVAYGVKQRDAEYKVMDRHTRESIIENAIIGERKHTIKLLLLLKAENGNCICYSDTLIDEAIAHIEGE